jgi:hypothetical protein
MRVRGQTVVGERERAGISNARVDTRSSGWWRRGGCEKRATEWRRSLAGHRGTHPGRNARGISAVGGTSAACQPRTTRARPTATTRGGSDALTASVLTVASECCSGGPHRCMASHAGELAGAGEGPVSTFCRARPDSQNIWRERSIHQKQLPHHEGRRREQ